MAARKPYGPPIARPKSHSRLFPLAGFRAAVPVVEAPMLLAPQLSDGRACSEDRLRRDGGQEGGEVKQCPKIWILDVQ